VPVVPTIATLNLKGGTGKTTTTAFVAHALHELGARVLAVDADPQASLSRWCEAAGFPFSCIAKPSRRLHVELPGIVGRQWNAVVIDTPPNVDEQHLGTEHSIGRRSISLSAVRAATHVLIPLSPSPHDYERLRTVRLLLEDAQDLDAQFQVGVLLVRTIAGAASTEVWRTRIVKDGWRVLRPQVPRREVYAQSLGQPVVNAAATGYGDAIAELLDAERAA
jgi:chromosome partitioning protein